MTGRYKARALDCGVALWRYWVVIDTATGPDCDVTVQLAERFQFKTRGLDTVPSHIATHLAREANRVCEDVETHVQQPPET